MTSRRTAVEADRRVAPNRAHQHRVLACVLTIALLWTQVTHGAQPPDLTQIQALLLGSADELDWERAKTLLDKLVAQNPGSPEVHRELARYHLNKGYINNSTYTPERVEAAARELDRAIELNPDFADALVVRGFVYRLQDRRGDAYAALDRAEKIGTDSPWLNLNRAELLSDEKRYVEALPLLQHVAKRKDIDGATRAQARADLARLYTRTGRLDDADAQYRGIVAAEPGNAYSHGNYAIFLLCQRDDYESAIVQVQQARRLGDYGLARSTHAAAMYRRWAGNVLKGHRAAVEASWDEAQAIADGDPAMLSQVVCGGGKPVPHVLEAMRTSGKGARVPPMAAIMLAADHAPHDVGGLFVLPVRSVGSSGGDLYLGSEEDYRDQRNLSVRITPKAQREMQTRYGIEPRAALKGTTIEVLGWARRVKIDFRQNGVPTGKFYYQTHIVVVEADQIVVRENRQAL